MTIQGQIHILHWWQDYGAFHQHVILLICAIFAFIGLASLVIGVINIHTEKSNRKKIINIISGILCLIGISGTIGVFMLNGNGNYYNPVGTEQQNVRILKSKQKLPHLYKLMNNENQKYGHTVDRSNKSLFKQNKSDKYRAAFFKHKDKVEKIKNANHIKSNNIKNGLHHIPKPSKIHHLFFKYSSLGSKS